MRKITVFQSFILLVCLCNVSFATNYYIASSGNDKNSGTNKTSPWKTLNKLDSFDFKAGDAIH